jgi:Reverse transcriptase (RNA-dependent DNA polymerase)
MLAWQLTPKDLKRYPHFDSQLSIKDAIALATNPKAVAAHTFYPFILYTNRWTRFAKKGERGSLKKRPIRYASRGDAYIFSYYRFILTQKYEAALSESFLNDSIIAYRRILNADGTGKCNIHFAYEAFDKIKRLGDCCVVALDISSFFESLDHGLLKSAWCNLLKVTKLPEDHYRIFRTITRYAFVEKQAVYERLGYYGPKPSPKLEKITNGYLVTYKKMPKQLCTGQEFREKIAGGDGSKSLINVNLKTYGIPQGSPISDLLANIYLFDFDRAVHKTLVDLGGFYLRYSDDILLIAPGGEKEGRALAEEIRGMIGKFGSRLIIKEKKSSVFVFTNNGKAQDFRVVQGTQGRNGIEYLGFRFDGRKVFIRDSTISNLYRKVARSSRYAVISLLKRYVGRDQAFLESRFDYEKLIQNFGRVKDFGELSDDYRNWTFWTYARRAAKIFGTLGSPMHRQLRAFRQNVRRRAASELAKAFAK